MDRVTEEKNSSAIVIVAFTVTLTIYETEKFHSLSN